MSFCFKGYLMTSHNNHNHQNTYECVDADPEYIHGEQANDNGDLFYFIRADCGRGGQCPPYVDNNELTCVVCTK